MRRVRIITLNLLEAVLRRATGGDSRKIRLASLLKHRMSQLSAATDFAKQAHRFIHKSHVAVGDAMLGGDYEKRVYGDKVKTYDIMAKARSRDSELATTKAKRIFSLVKKLSASNQHRNPKFRFDAALRRMLHKATVSGTVGTDPRVNKAYADLTRYNNGKRK